MTLGSHPPTAVVTGGSAGLGLALTTLLADAGWRVVIDGRRPERLSRARGSLPQDGDVVPIAGDVTDSGHRHAVRDAVGDRLDLLVHNASTLGPSGLDTLERQTAEDLQTTFQVNVIAPVALTTLLLPALRAAGGTIVTISSDAGVEHYETWGGYGASKAALDHVAGTLAAENPDLRVLAVDPGDMRTEMHQQAFPGEDISDRPKPDSAALAIVNLVNGPRPSGRYRAHELEVTS